jgi:hypothetical protein
MIRNARRCKPRRRKGGGRPIVHPRPKPLSLRERGLNYSLSPMPGRGQGEGHGKAIGLTASIAMEAQVDS